MKNASVYKATFSNMTRCIFFIAIFAPAILHAQSRGTVEVIKDPRIDTLAARRTSLKGSRTIALTTAPATIAAGPSTYSASANGGYRVQIYSGSSRSEAYDAQARFRDKYHDMRTYIIYVEPNFKVRAGDFRTHLEAEKLMQELRKSFTSLFIIEEKVTPSKAGTGND